MKTARSAWAQTGLIAIGFTACLLMIGITPYGAGVGPDSVTYIAGAESIRSGHGYSITHFPPFYSATIALVGLFERDLVQASRALNALLFGVNAILIVLAVYWATARHLLTSASAAIFFLASVPFLEAHAWAWSEPLFIALSFASLVLVSYYVIRPTTSLLVTSSLLMGVSLLTRYIGLGFIPAALLLVLLGNGTRSVRDKGRAVLTWGLLATAPLGLFLAKNMMTVGNTTNRSVTFHPPSLLGLADGVYAVVLAFFAPVRLPTGATPLVIGFLALVPIITVAAVWMHRHRLRHWRRIEIVLPLTALLCIASYLLFLFVSLSLFDAATPVDSRILSPVLALLVLGCFATAWGLWHVSRTQVVTWSLVLLIGLTLAIKTRNAMQYAWKIHGHGIGYTARRWQASDGIAYARSVPRDVNIYSNGRDVIRFLTGRRVLTIPSKISPSTMRENRDFRDMTVSMCAEVIAGTAVLVYFDDFTWRGYLPTKQEIEAICPLPIVANATDGTIYGRP